MPSSVIVIHDIDYATASTREHANPIDLDIHVSVRSSRFIGMYKLRPRDDGTTGSHYLRHSCTIDGKSDQFI